MTAQKHSFLEEYAERISVVATAVAIAALLWGTDFSGWLALVAGGLAIMGVILQLTRPLIFERHLGAVFRLAYAFGLTIGVGLPVTLLLIQKPFVPTLGATDAKTGVCLARRYAPLAIVPGCDYTAEPFLPSSDPNSLNSTRGREESPGMPYHVYCDALPPQWVISFGGNVLQCHVDGDCDEVLRLCAEGKEPQSLAAPEAAAPARSVSQIDGDIAGIEGEIASAQRARGAAVGAAKFNSDAQKEAAAQSTRLQSLQSRLTALKREKASAQAPPPPVTKASTEVIKNLDAHLITGGLVVPVYFVALTLLGALVSMLRRLPEYQHRASDAYLDEFDGTVAATDAEPSTPLSYGKARDYVVFQMIQVASAPVIGVVAYAWAKPREIPSTTLLAFAAGFSSDVFLLAIRSFAERIAGTEIPKVQPRRVSEKSLEKSAESGPVARMLKQMAPAAAPVTAMSVTGVTFKIGDRVQLLDRINEFVPGDSGKIFAINSGDQSIRVEIDRSASGRVGRLPPQPADKFAPEGAVPQSEGPVG